MQGAWQWQGLHVQHFEEPQVMRAAPLAKPILILLPLLLLSTLSTGGTGSLTRAVQLPSISDSACALQPQQPVARHLPPATPLATAASSGGSIFRARHAPQTARVLKHATAGAVTRSARKPVRTVGSPYGCGSEPRSMKCRGNHLHMQDWRKHWRNPGTLPRMCGCRLWVRFQTRLFVENHKHATVATPRVDIRTHEMQQRVRHVRSCRLRARARTRTIQIWRNIKTKRPGASNQNKPNSSAQTQKQLRV